MSNRPILIYDGDCSFCKFWVERWKHVTGSAIDYAPYQEVSVQYPQIPKENFEKSIQLILPGGEVFAGAHAAFRSLAFNSNYAWPLVFYERFSPFQFLSELFYGFVAQNRVLFSHLTKLFIGRSTEPSTYFISQRIFLAWLGLTYFFAFVSLGIQVKGLYGVRGILSVSEYLKAAEMVLGPRSLHLLPSLLWLNSSDFFLQFLCWAGAILSIGLILGIAVFPISVFLWFAYLSFVATGQDFMSFQWDVLLLEAGFLSIFVAPLKLKFKTGQGRGPSFAFVFLMRWLLFRLMFSSGLVKFASGDTAWRNWTALLFHYETQPLPTWIGWYVHQLPARFHQFSVGVMFFVELFVPFLIFFPRRARLFSVFAITSFQILIGATGNYCFFNFLTIGLCLWLIDDQSWPSALRAKLQQVSTPNVHNPFIGLETTLRGCAAVLIFLLSFVQISPLAPFHLVNHYGLFAVMTTQRPEIIVEGSSDGVTWLPYEFRYKPGDLKSKPAFIEPGQPRLDWQMWFAALSDYRRNKWFLRFCRRLLEGSPEVSALLKTNPFANSPPQFIRAVVYQYHFTNLSQKRQTGTWWTRERTGLYCPVLESSSFQ